MLCRQCSCFSESSALEPLYQNTLNTTSENQHRVLVNYFSNLFRCVSISRTCPVVLGQYPVGSRSVLGGYYRPSTLFVNREITSINRNITSMNLNTTSMNREITSMNRSHFQISTVSVSLDCYRAFVDHRISYIF